MPIMLLMYIMPEDRDDDSSTVCQYLPDGLCITHVFANAVVSHKRLASAMHGCTTSVLDMSEKLFRRVLQVHL